MRQTILACGREEETKIILLMKKSHIQIQCNTIFESVQEISVAITHGRATNAQTACARALVGCHKCMLAVAVRNIYRKTEHTQDQLFERCDLRH